MADWYNEKIKKKVTNAEKSISYLITAQLFICKVSLLSRVMKEGFMC